MRRWLWMLPSILVLAVAIAVVILSLSDDEAGADTVRYQGMTERGEDPFTRPADVKSDTTVRLPAGTFGGTGSNVVCDRELLIRQLRADPEKLREWARVLGVEPTEGAVANYIRSLTPVTLTRDTPVTNHRYAGGKAIGYQAFLAAGTAVLVDDKGVPRVRCRCGNPLLEPDYKPTYKCIHCPPKYKYPKPRCYYGKCWRRHPDPPPAEPPTEEPLTGQPGGETPTASFSPNPGKAGDAFTLSVSGFKPNTTLTVTLTRPDGVEEPYEITTDATGSGSKAFPPDPTVITGTYSATVTDPATGDEATASVEVGEADTGTDTVPPEGTPPPGGVPPPEGTPPPEGVPPEGTPPQQDGGLQTP